MTGTVSPREAADALARQAHLRAHVAAGTARYTAWLTGMAAASSFFVFALGLHEVDDVADIVALAVALGALVAVLSIALLPGARVSARGFNRRFGLSVGIWGAIFGLAVGLGLSFALPGWAFWVAAPLVAAPLLAGASLELRGPRD